jgi:hypothetical protein
MHACTYIIAILLFQNVKESCHFLFIRNYKEGSSLKGGDKRATDDSVRHQKDLQLLCGREWQLFISDEVW